MAVTVGPTVPSESSTGVPAGGFSQWFRNIGDWAKLLSPNGASQYETDWMPLTLETGFAVQGSPAPRVKRIGKTIHLSGLIRPSSGALAAGQTYLIARIPAGFTPTIVWYPGGRSNNADITVNFDIRPEGTIHCGVNGPATWVSLAGVIYTVD